MTGKGKGKVSIASSGNTSSKPSTSGTNSPQPTSTGFTIPENEETLYKAFKQFMLSSMGKEILNEANNEANNSTNTSNPTTPTSTGNVDPITPKLN
eukprot:Nk52_evm1s1908 gene=Nk52_evmTU1s1908